MKKIGFILFFILVAAASFAQPSKNLIPAKPEDVGMSSEKLGRIDTYLQDYVSKNWIPGAVVLIARNGKLVYHKAFGYSDVESKTALKKDNIFRIASQSKAITSLAVMILFEEGKFQLDDAVSKYIPEFKSQRVLDRLNWIDTTYTTQPAKSEITIRQLLTHTSGLDYAGIGSLEFKAIYAKAGIPSGIGNDNMILSEKMKILGSLPLKHHPGEQYTYGLNVDVLGYLVEVLSGMPFDQFLNTRIFQPLGMNDTYFYLPKEKHNRLVTLYESKGGLIKKVDHKIYDGINPDYPKLEGKYHSGGAGLSSTVEDYAKFLQLFLNKGEFNGTRLLSRKTVELMLTNQTQPPITTQFGLGFGLETEKNDHQSIVSLGTFSWGGAFNSQYWADPKEKLILIIYTNMYNSPYRTGDYFKNLTYQAIID
jgi:CubicO group peptidase (beta-lactamase class C family)